MTVIPFPRSKRETLFLVSRRPAWPYTPNQFYRTWYQNCLVNASVAVLIARHFGIRVAHAVPNRSSSSSSEVLIDESRIRILRNESVFTFTYPSIFQNETLREFIERCGVCTVGMIGFPANEIAIASAIDANSYGYDLEIMRDCSPLLKMSGISVSEADHILFESIARHGRVLNFGDYLLRFLPEKEPSGQAFQVDGESLDEEALHYFLDHLAEHADKLGHRGCARTIRKAASEISPMAPILGDVRAD